jgi:hypothetical protein
MSLQVIGAGVGRTGTSSLKLALERLLDGRCYHMYEVQRSPGHTPMWRAAVHGEPIDWAAIYDGYVATVDWPGAAFWRELMGAFPDALVLLSLRSSAEEWFDSARSTIDEILSREPPPASREWHAMASELVTSTFTPLPMVRAAAIAAYDRHNAAVRATVPPERLLEWTAGDGWEPLCERLGIAVPDDPFPHVNTRQGFTAMIERRLGRDRFVSRMRRRLRR